MVTMLLGTPVGQRIKSLREDHRWTQEELAGFAGVPRSWLGLVETGEIAAPGAARLHKLAKALSTSTDFLLTGEHPSDLINPETEILFRQIQESDLPPETIETLNDFMRFALERHRAKHPDSAKGR